MPKTRSVQTKLKSSHNDNAWKTIGRAKKREQSSDGSNDANSKKTDSKNTPPRDALTKPSQPDPRTIPIPSSPSSSVEDSSLAESSFLSTIKGTTNKVPTSVTSQIPQKELAKGKLEIPTTPTTSPILSNDEIFEAEQELIAAINAINSSKKFISLLEKEFPPITSSPTKPNTNNKKKQLSSYTTDLDIVMTEANNELVEESNQTVTHKNDNKLESVNYNIPSAFVSSFPKQYPPDWSTSR
jgi:hypothetical protein